MPKAKDSVTTTAPAAVAPKPRTGKRPAQLPPYRVVLLNDDDHTYEYVITMLRSIFGYSVERGYELAKEVDTQGRAIVLVTHKELAELKREQIAKFGRDQLVASCAGSMTAYIEPADL